MTTVAAKLSKRDRLLFALEEQGARGMRPSELAATVGRDWKRVLAALEDEGAILRFERGEFPTGHQGFFRVIMVAPPRPASPPADPPVIDDPALFEAPPVAARPLSALTEGETFVEAEAPVEGWTAKPVLDLVYDDLYPEGLDRCVIQIHCSSWANYRAMQADMMARGSVCETCVDAGGGLVRRRTDQLTDRGLFLVAVSPTDTALATAVAAA